MGFILNTDWWIPEIDFIQEVFYLENIENVENIY